MCIVELVDHYTKIQRSTVIVEDKIQIDKYSGDLKAIPHRYQINLRGTKTNCGEVFRDPDTGIESKFFVFNDLAVRTMGKYRLRASIFNLDRYAIFLEVNTSIDIDPIQMDLPSIPNHSKFNRLVIMVLE